MVMGAGVHVLIPPRRITGVVFWACVGSGFTAPGAALCGRCYQNVNGEGMEKFYFAACLNLI